MDGGIAVAHELKDQAPGGLALVEAFVNTVTFLYDRETLADPAALHEWLTGHGLLEAGSLVTAGDLHHAVAVREALRAQLGANNGAPLAAAAVATINDAFAAADVRVQLDHTGQAQLMVSAGGMDRARGLVLVRMVAAMADGTWAHLKSCRNEACRWAFYDRAKNHSGQWCVMAVCGNRSKTRRYRRRRAAPTGSIT